jgi:glycosyltransferase involved in cell wall biosynthesis
MSHLTDLELRRHLARVNDGVVLTTRPSLHLAALQLLPDGVPVVGQDHGHFGNRFAHPGLTAVLDHAVPRLDAFVVLTAADAEDYRTRFPDVSSRIHQVPNALPWPVPETPAPLRTKVVVSIGRLDANKGHDRLVRAFAPVAAQHPDWRLHIYGAGPEDHALEALVGDLGLTGQVELRGYTADPRAVLADASVYALTSRSESFSMSLIEAMSMGVPPVAMDCPRGPREIVDDGVNGALVPDGDEVALTDALLRLIEDETLRRALGVRAHHDAQRWSMAQVGRSWERLLAGLTDANPVIVDPQHCSAERDRSRTRSGPH